MINNAVVLIGCNNGYSRYERLFLPDLKKRMLALTKPHDTADCQAKMMLPPDRVRCRDHSLNSLLSLPLRFSAVILQKMPNITCHAETFDGIMLDLLTMQFVH
jgi:hypothetical protein